MANNPLKFQSEAASCSPSARDARGDHPLYAALAGRASCLDSMTHNYSMKKDGQREPARTVLACVTSCFVIFYV
jgi:hypothetical protein